MVILKSSNMDRDLGEGLRVRAYLVDSLPMTAKLNSRYPLLLGFGLFGSGLVLG